MSVTERTREIGILSAVGWNPVRILSMIVLQGLILAAIGTVLGLVLGVAALKAFLTDPTLRGIIEPGISLRVVIEALVASVLLGGVGGLYPAWRAARAHPVESLRYG
jgi:putative ABC transport system permease protein